MSPLTVQVLLGVVPIVASVLAVAAAVYTARKNARTVQDVERLKDELSQASAQRDADRAYLVEIRKRIYDECEPLVMRLAESADHAADRITEFADPRRWPECRAVRETDRYWMLSNSSEVVSFSHALLAPLGWSTLFGEAVTPVDLRFDSRLSGIYTASTNAYKVHLQDYRIADLAPALRYTPVVEGWRAKRVREPATYWWQGLTKGNLDSAVEVVIHREARRVTSYSEYEARYHDLFDRPDDRQNKSLGLFCNPVYNFTPDDRPVYWRVLIIQLLLYRHLAAICRVPVDGTAPRAIEFRPSDVAALRRHSTRPDDEFDAALLLATNYAQAALSD